MEFILNFLPKYRMGNHSSAAIQLPLGRATSCYQCWFKSATTLLLLQSPGKQQMVAKHLCTSLLTGETQIYRFLIFAWHKPSCHEHLGSEPVNQRLVYLSLSLYFIWINKSKNATERQNTLGKWEVIKWIFF